MNLKVWTVPRPGTVGPLAGPAASISRTEQRLNIVRCLETRRMINAAHCQLYAVRRTVWPLATTQFPLFHFHMDFPLHIFRCSFVCFFFPFWHFLTHRLAVSRIIVPHVLEMFAVRLSLSLRH